MKGGGAEEPGSGFSPFLLSCPSYTLLIALGPLCSSYIHSRALISVEEEVDGRGISLL